MAADFTDCYCTDEDIAAECTGDYPVIVPDDQRLAQGTDGLPAGWVLSSGTTDWAARGIVPGMAVRLIKNSVIRDDLLIVDSVDAGGVTLRRKGLAAGQGQPPTAAGSAPLAFEVKTCLPQIKEATRRLVWAYPHAPADPEYNPLDFKEACVYRVLVMLYGGDFVAASRDDTWIRKRKIYLDMLATLEGRLAEDYPPPLPPEVAGGALLKPMPDAPDWLIPRDFPRWPHRWPRPWQVIR